MSKYRDAYVVILPAIGKHVATLFNNPEDDKYGTVDWLDLKGSSIRNIRVCVDAPQLLSIEVDWGDVEFENAKPVWADDIWTNAFTYSGPFWVEWSDPPTP